MSLCTCGKRFQYELAAKRIRDAYVYYPTFTQYRQDIAPAPERKRLDAFGRQYEDRGCGVHPFQDREQSDVAEL